MGFFVLAFFTIKDVPGANSFGENLNLSPGNTRRLSEKLLSLQTAVPVDTVKNIVSILI